MEKELFTELYEASFRLVWNVCLTMLRNPADTEDAVQETFLRLLREPTPPESVGHLQAWLIVTARNICRDELRRFRRRELCLDEARDFPTEAPEIDETLSAVRMLPEKYRLPLYLYYYEELPTARIAQILGRKESTVRSDLRRGREKLRPMLGGMEDEK